MSMKVTCDNKKLVIEIDVDNSRPLSSTGKTKRVASTCGAVKTGVQVDGKELTVNLNAYIPAD